VLGHCKPPYAAVVVPGKRHRRLKKHHAASGIPARAPGHRELIGLVLGHCRPPYAVVVVPGKRHRAPLEEAPHRWPAPGHVSRHLAWYSPGVFKK
jgi:hypothetical protein